MLLSLPFLQHSQKGSAQRRPPPREFAHWGCEERTDAVGQKEVLSLPLSPSLSPSVFLSRRATPLVPGARLRCPGPCIYLPVSLSSAISSFLPSGQSPLFLTRQGPRAPLPCLACGEEAFLSHPLSLSLACLLCLSLRPCLSHASDAAHRVRGHTFDHMCPCRNLAVSFVHAHQKLQLLPPT